MPGGSCGCCGGGGGSAVGAGGGGGTAGIGFGGVAGVSGWIVRFGRTAGLNFDPKVRPRSAWKLGAQVRHPKYGLGTVIECEGEGADIKLTISFRDYGIKKLVERYASLEKV